MPQKPSPSRARVRRAWVNVPSGRSPGRPGARGRTQAGVGEAQGAPEHEAHHGPPDLEQLLLVDPHHGAEEGPHQGPGGGPGEGALPQPPGVLVEHGEDHEGAEDEGRDVGRFLGREGEGEAHAEGVVPGAPQLQDVAHQARRGQHRPGDGVAVLAQHAGEVGEAGGEDEHGHRQHHPRRPQPAPPEDGQPHQGHPEDRRHGPGRPFRRPQEEEAGGDGEELEGAVQEGVVLVELPLVGVPGELGVHALVVVHGPLAEGEEAGQDEGHQEPAQEQGLPVGEAEVPAPAEPLLEVGGRGAAHGAHGRGPRPPPPGPRRGGVAAGRSRARGTGGGRRGPARAAPGRRAAGLPAPRPAAARAGSALPPQHLAVQHLVRGDVYGLVRRAVRRAFGGGRRCPLGGRARGPGAGRRTAGCSPDGHDALPY